MFSKYISRIIRPFGGPYAIIPARRAGFLESCKFSFWHRGSQICYMVRNVRPCVRPSVRSLALPVTFGSYPAGRLQAYRSVLRILWAICIGALCIPEPDIHPCAGVAPLAEALGSGLWWLAEVLVVQPACVTTVYDRI
jgi:hypothetical protein